jgi:ribosomal protein S18 acetylase RimI-like enzyme
MAEITIRRAGLGDAEALAALGARTFADTFGRLYPPEDLESFLAQAYTPAAFAWFLEQPEQAMWLGEAAGEPVGYAHAGPCALPHPEVTPRCGELKRLYVSKDRQNAGLGGHLLEVALDWLEAPERRLWIGVWSENWGAQRLYGRYGFAKVGEYEFPVGKTRDLEFIFRRG